VRRLLAYLLTIGWAFGLAPAHAGAVATEDFTIPSKDAGISLQVRNLHQAGRHKFPDRELVLFVHGATFPSTVAFDFDLPGGSWMRQLAGQGFDVYSLDIRGYGGSTRPRALDEPPEANPPFATTAEAARDIAAAVDYILKRRGAQALNLVGWSWGTTTTATFAAAEPAKIRRLVLVSPVWLPMQPPKYQGAWRASTHDGARAFMTGGIPAERVSDISPVGTFERWW